MNRLFDADTSSMWDIVLTQEERSYLQQLASSRQEEDRERCLDLLSSCLYPPANREFALATLDDLITNATNGIRERSLTLLEIVLVEGKPSEVWSFVQKHASDESYDQRKGIALHLLEHLLEHHFDEYFPKIQQAILDGNTSLFYTLKCIRYSVQSGENKQSMADFVSQMERSV
jgi:hypothetical protein